MQCWRAGYLEYNWVLLAVDVYDLGVDVEVLADAIGPTFIGVGAPSCQGSGALTGELAWMPRTRMDRLLQATFIKRPVPCSLKRL